MMMFLQFTQHFMNSTSGQHRSTSRHPPMDAGPAGLLSIAEETVTEFLSKATGTAVEWVQMPGMKPGPDSNGIIAISHGCTGVAAHACGLVGLEPTRAISCYSSHIAFNLSVTDIAIVVLWMFLTCCQQPMVEPLNSCTCSSMRLQLWRQLVTSV
ncbi:homeodomain transcription factor [Lithospermum erythrorhizon]|uniref:Homeodomain transcription factor n=1 Tax=Lithospermum erythrorhizon TaxID=34254 RepID=A0AAV3R9F5_LITER